MKIIAIGEGHNTPQDMGVQYKDENSHLIEFCENLKILPFTIEHLYKWGYRVEDFHGHLIREKVPFVNSRIAELSIEIHHNWYSSEKIRGAEVIYHPNSKRGKKAAELMLDAIRDEGFETRGVFEGYYRYDKSKGFYAFTAKLWKPSIIVECGYFSDPVFRLRVKELAYAQDFGLAIAKGARNYVENY